MELSILGKEHGICNKQNSLSQFSEAIFALKLARLMEKLNAVGRDTNTSSTSCSNSIIKTL